MTLRESDSKVHIILTDFLHYFGYCWQGTGSNTALLEHYTSQANHATSVYVHLRDEVNDTQIQLTYAKTHRHTYVSPFTRMYGPHTHIHD